VSAGVTRFCYRYGWLCPAVVFSVYDSVCVCSRWYISGITRGEGEELLLQRDNSGKYKQKDGAFLVRPSESAPGDFSLSVKWVSGLFLVLWNSFSVVSTRICPEVWFPFSGFRIQECWMMLGLPPSDRSLKYWKAVYNQWTGNTKYSVHVLELGIYLGTLVSFLAVERRENARIYTKLQVGHYTKSILSITVHRVYTVLQYFKN